MRCARVAAVLVAGVLAGCGGSDRAHDYATFDTATAARDSVVRDSSDRPLAEFEPLTAADVELYLKVMRTAAGRLRNLSDTDRRALQTWRDMNQGVPRAQVPPPDELIALQRAGELASLDAAVARDMGVEQRFSSISSRVDDFLAPDLDASGDEPLPPEQRARVQERIRRFRELQRADAALLQPHRAEVVSLRNQVRIALPPVDAPD